jgi:hypothetical protein
MARVCAIAIFVGLVVSAMPGVAATERCGVYISESNVQIASISAYVDLLFQSYEKGWRFAPRQVENGFRRHFEELKLRLENEGYAIAPEGAAGTASDCRSVPNSRACVLEPRSLWGTFAPTLLRDRARDDHTSDRICRDPAVSRQNPHSRSRLSRLGSPRQAFARSSAAFFAATASPLAFAVCSRP